MPNPIVRWFSRRDVRREDEMLATAEAHSGAVQTDLAEVTRLRLELIKLADAAHYDGVDTSEDMAYLIADLARIEGWK